MTYDKSMIMKKAWRNYKQAKRIAGKLEMKVGYSYFLKNSWAEAKAEAARQKAAEEQSRLNMERLSAMKAIAANNPRIKAIDEELFMLDMIDRQSREEKEIVSRLQAEKAAILKALTADINAA